MPHGRTHSENSAIATLVLFSKRPQPGVGKQRVAATLGKTLDYELASLLFNCALEDLNTWPGRRVICIADDSDIDWAAAHAGSAEVVAQSTGNLGERLAAATASLTGLSAPILFIGCDAPTITPDYLDAAAAQLGASDIVLGSAQDGGVVVMGTTHDWPTLTELPWSTAELGRALQSASEAGGKTVTTLPAHTDIDCADDLARVASQLHTDTRPARQALYHWITLHDLHETQDTAPYNTGTNSS